jgi:chitinase
MNAPLFNRSSEIGDQGILNVDWAVNYWLMNGMPAEKLILGLAAYGRTFILTNSSNSKPGDPAKGAGRAGSQTGQDGFISYYEICEKLSQGWIRVWQDEHKAPYAYSGVNWVGYDDVESLRIKVDYLKSKKLGGAMVWAIDLDDFSGSYCNQGKYPFINYIKTQLSLPIPIETTSKLVSTSSYKVQINPNFCKNGDGFYSDLSSNCQKYYRCINSFSLAQIFWYTCPLGTIFDRIKGTCNWTNFVTCQ